MKNLILAFGFLLLTALPAGAAVTYSIQWTAPTISGDGSNTPTQYNIYQNGTKVGQVAYPTLTSDIVVSDAPGTQECFTVTAQNSAGESAQSQPGCQPVPIIVVIPGTPGQVVIIKVQ